MSVMEKIARAAIVGTEIALNRAEVGELLERFSQLEAECAMHVKSREADRQAIVRAAKSVRELLRGE